MLRGQSVLSFSTHVVVIHRRNTVILWPSYSPAVSFSIAPMMPSYTSTLWSLEVVSKAGNRNAPSHIKKATTVLAVLT